MIRKTILASLAISMSFAIPAATAAPNSGSSLSRMATAQDMVDHPPRRLMRRARRLMQRIQDGRADGSLTRWEVRKLRRQQRRILRQVHHLNDGGFHSRYERRNVAMMLERQSQRIHRMRHNGDYRGRYSHQRRTYRSERTTHHTHHNAYSQTTYHQETRFKGNGKGHGKGKRKGRHGRNH